MTPQTILLFLNAFLVGSDEFLLGPILTPIALDLSVPPERITLFIGAYALPLAVLSPVLGGLSDRFGRRRVLLPSVALFCLGSFATALAPGYDAAILSRVVTGLGAAGMLPVAFAIAADSGPARAPVAIAAVQAGLTCGIILAPLYGAVITESLGWHAAFAGLASAAALLIPGMGGLEERRIVPAAGKGRLRVPGAFASIIAMGLGLGGAIGIYALAGERLRDIAGLDTAGTGIVYGGFGCVTLMGNLLMPAAIRHVRDGRQLMLICMAGVMLAIAALFGMRLSLAGSVGVLAVWALLGGIGAPGLQTYLSGLSESRRGTLMALGASAMNLGVAVWSAVAAQLYAFSAAHVAGLAILIVGTAILALSWRQAGPEA